MSKTFNEARKAANSTLNLGEVLKFKGDSWLRAATIFILTWYGILIGFALWPVEAMQQILIILPFIGMLMLWLKEPSAILGATTWNKTSSISKRIISIAAYQEVWAIIIWFLPINNNRSLVLPLVVILLTIGLFKLSGQRSIFVTLLWIAAAIIAVSFFASGMELTPAAQAQTAPVATSGQFLGFTTTGSSPANAPAKTGSTASTQATPTANTFPVAEPSLSVWAEPVPYIATPGSTVRLTVVIGNHGGGDAENLVVTVELPDGLVFAETGKRVETWQIEDIPKNVGERSVSTTILVEKSTVPGGYDFIVTVNADNLPQKFSVPRSLVVNNE